MVTKKYSFSNRTVDCFFNANFSMLGNLVKKENTFLITDENVYSKQAEKFAGWKTIILKAGEQYKNQDTVNDAIGKLIAMHADRQSFIVGVGGGVITDMAGFIASIYMRGIRFGFVPTSILGMVDASVGGKNGIDVGIYKNLVGVINHPQFLLYDYSFLETLPREEWVNGFAEIIKHACIKDDGMFHLLQEKTLSGFQDSIEIVGKLIEQNVEIKCNVVSNDEFETGDRKLLNFGHTIGHAIENTAKLPHGSAISIGMMAACRISEKINHFPKEETEKIRRLLSKYHLPVEFQFDKQSAWNVLLHDKKKSGNDINFIVLNSIGKASVRKIILQELQQIFFSLG